MEKLEHPLWKLYIFECLSFLWNILYGCPSLLLLLLPSFCRFHSTTPQYSSTNFSFLKFSHFCCQVALFQSYKIYNISCIIVFKHRFSEKALYVLFVGFFARYVSSFSANHQLLAKTFKSESKQNKILLNRNMYVLMLRELNSLVLSA